MGRINKKEQFLGFLWFPQKRLMHLSSLLLSCSPHRGAVCDLNLQQNSRKRRISINAHQTDSLQKAGLQIGSLYGVSICASCGSRMFCFLWKEREKEKEAGMATVFITDPKRPILATDKQNNRREVHGVNIFRFGKAKGKKTSQIDGFRLVWQKEKDVSRNQMAHERFFRPFRKLWEKWFWWKTLACRTVSEAQFFLI